MKTYDILIENHAIEAVKRLVEDGSNRKDVFVVTDDHVKAFHLETLRRVLDPIHLHVVSITPGETSKSVSTMLDVIGQLLTMGIKRDHLLIGFGGGVVTDLAGFVAAILYRGITYAAIPTTLLAQVDASIGSKTGIDLAQGKNLLGAFKDPAWVLIDPMFLETLPKEVRIDGLAEMIKAALIADPVLYQMLKDDDEITEKKIIRAVEVKRSIVMKDPYERHERMLLNFGHTFGHAIERKHHYETYTHGVAVAYGMLIAMGLGVRQGITPKALYDDVLNTLKKTKLVTEPLLLASDYVSHIGFDKKQLSDGLRFIFLEDIGQAVIKTVRMEDLL